MRIGVTSFLGIVIVGGTISCEVETPQDREPLRITVGETGESTDDIYVVNADGTLGQNLTNTPEGHGSWIPSFSPDCRKIAFASNRDEGGNADIYVMGADGSNIQRLTWGEESDYWPKFSPDGTHIIFSKYVNEVRAIWVMDADGSNQRPLLDQPGGSEYSERPWSPDGNKILFTVGRDLCVGDPDGSNVRCLAEARDSAEFNHASLGRSWSQDGSKILFASNRDGNLEAWLMNADGSGQRQLTHTSGEIIIEPVSWSPDDTHIVFNWNYVEVYVMHADGGNVRRLTRTTETSGMSRALVWRTDGILFTSTPDTLVEDTRHFVMDPDGTNIRLWGPSGHGKECRPGSGE